jgi:hypothetical protein
MLYRLSGSDGVALDATFEVEGATVVFHSRGSAKGADRNPDYATGLRLMLERLSGVGVEVVDAWVDSSRVQHLPLEQRSLFGPDDRGATPSQLYTRFSSRMAQIGRAEGAREGGGNPTKRIRIQLPAHLSEAEIVALLKGEPDSRDIRSRDRLPAEQLHRVTSEHIWNAIQRLQAGYSDHGFGPSTDYDLIGDDGSRLPPKAVFGVAATEALGFDVLPRHFTAGTDSACFQVLAQAGYKIVPKGAAVEPTAVEVADQEWSEGSPKMRTHLARERSAGLRAAKREQFRRLHGRLFCERCGEDPVAHYGTPHAESCIEVHHHEVHVKDMANGHGTRLEDLRCLCANCHRLVHRLQREGVSVEAVSAE